MGIPPTGPTVIYEDNKSAIAMSNQPHQQPQSRHINRRFLWVKEKVRNQEIRLEFKSTKEQRADALTKIISGKAFFDERDKILGAKIAVELTENHRKREQSA